MNLHPDPVECGGGAIVTTAAEPEAAAPEVGPFTWTNGYSSGFRRALEIARAEYTAELARIDARSRKRETFAQSLLALACIVVVVMVAWSLAQ